ncbi:MAG: PilZ domain-containing protein [Desulfobacterales bacterium]|nr:PilZ domain-containing protein [Desulfobacterales bacterium]
MAEEITEKNHSDRRSEAREPSRKFHSVEMKLSSLPIYLFKLKDISSKGASFLVKEGSSILKHLKVGQILDMRYHSEDEMEPSEIFKSEIKYIKKNHEGPFNGHYSVGIMLLEKQAWTFLQDEYDESKK